MGRFVVSGDSGTGSAGGPVDRSGATAPGAEAEAPETDAVRLAINRARSAALSRGLSPGGSERRGGQRRRIAGEARRSGAYPDARDPQRLGAGITRLVSENGWAEPVAVGGVVGRWASVVGSDIAEHCLQEEFSDGALNVRADSSAWATQLRLLVPTLLRRFAEDIGQDTVHTVVVRGPAAPSWRRGPRLAPGSRGPRDTYG
jgi:predicted nucleic acid-binding Zn ribbon protein